MLAPLLLGCLLQTTSPVRINEVAYNDSGIDDIEFVELHNSSASAVSIGGWVLGGNDTTTTNASYTIPATATIPAGGFYVIGGKTVPNVNWTPTLAGTNLWENANEAIVLKDGAGTGAKVVDKTNYEIYRGRGGSMTTPIGDTNWGRFLSMTASAGSRTYMMSLARARDGLSFGNGRAWTMRPQTPGKSNNLLPKPVTFDNFSAGATKLDTPIPNWAGSWVDPRYIDPTKVGKGNPNPIPAAPAPGGGTAISLWDETGGGDGAVFLANVERDYVVECFVYIQGNPAPKSALTAGGYLATQLETWSIGVQGTTDFYYNYLDPSKTVTTKITRDWHSNGNTGVSVTYQAVTEHNATTGAQTSHTVRLYLIDHNDGGYKVGAGTPATDAKILGTIDLKAKSLTGWQRLRLEVHDNVAEVFVGGSFGTAAGTRVGGILSQAALGGVYMGYREFIGDNTKTRPLTIDNLLIRRPTSKIAYSGTAKKSTKGTPDIRALAAPTIGNPGFSVTCGGLVAGSASLWLVDLTSGATPPAINLGGLGGQAGAFLYANPTLTQPLTNSATGTATFGPLTVPNDTRLVGTVIHGQVLDLDPALLIALPFGTSRRLTLTVGQ